jgi:putative alpha-1,2-mannosidase
LSRPKFLNARINLSNGKSLSIIKNGIGKYPKTAYINGIELTDMKISAKQFMLGGELVFEY